MPLDAICIGALAQELQTRIVNGRIDKVQQPERDMLLLSLRANCENLRLLIAAGTGNARAHLSHSTFENPAEPPMFCMLLRKHLIGARILSVIQPDHERMMILDLDTSNELGVHDRKQLIVEMIGRNSNVILVGEDGRILDCMRRVDWAGDNARRLLPGMIYRMPPKQNKPDFLTLGPDERQQILKGWDGEQELDRWLLAQFSGLSPLICRELVTRCHGDAQQLGAQMDALAECVDRGELAPYMLLRDGKPMDFSFLSVSQYGAVVQCRQYESFSSLLDEFYSQRDRAEQQRRRSQELLRSVKSARDRQARKLVGQRADLARTEGREDVRHRAELITANLYRLQKGEACLLCEDYAQPGCPEIRIPLDPMKTPQQNAAALYKEYNKLKTAEYHLTELIAQGEQQLEYLNSVLEALERAETEKDLRDIRRELLETGVLRQKKQRGKQDKSKAQAPRRFLSDDGLEILVGRSNLQNDELTLKTARRTDYWLHTQKVHGSHVILRCEDLEPPERSLYQAACIAAYYSQGRDSGKLPVDYTMVRFVRKPAGALPGKVVYTEYKTITVAADEDLIHRLQK